MDQQFTAYTGPSLEEVQRVIRGHNTYFTMSTSARNIFYNFYIGLSAAFHPSFNFLLT